MARVKLNPLVEQLRGPGILLGQPAFPWAEAVLEPMDQRERLRQTVLYGCTVLAGPEAHHNKRAFSLNLADFGNASAVDEIDLSAYGGAIGDRITVRTRYDCGVTVVRVSLADGYGSEIESGEAGEIPPCSDSWVYFARKSISAGTPLCISVIAGSRDELGTFSPRRAS